MAQITFVCSGNTCRSPMAEGIFNRIIADRKIENVSCRSCGLSAFSGDEASENSVIACRKYGVDISLHRATQLNQYIFDQTDIMVCMTQGHKRAVLTLNPEFPIIVPSDGICDPYGGDLSVYENCAEQIYFFCEKLADTLQSEIAPMRENDIEQIAEIEKLCFSSPWTVDGLREELTNITAHFLVCRSGERVLGYIGVNEVCDEAYIDNIAVLPDYRRMYLGEKLLKQAQSDAFSRCCSFISLEVRAGNEKAIALYKKLGYNTVGERRNFYTNPTENALIMTLNKGEC